VGLLEILNAGITDTDTTNFRRAFKRGLKEILFSYTTTNIRSNRRINNLKKNTKIGQKMKKEKERKWYRNCILSGKWKRTKSNV
jgi:hypothetical protein